jgi:hypothetical protein
MAEHDNPDVDAPSATKAGLAGRVESAMRWAAAALAAAGVFGAGSFGFDRIAEGRYSSASGAMLIAAVVVFALGVIGVVIAAVWVSRASRVTLTSIVNADDFSTFKRAKQVLDESPYLLDGRSVEDFRNRLNELVVARQRDGVAFRQSDREELNRLIRAKDVALATARAERVNAVGRRATWVFAISAVVAAIGATSVALATSYAEHRQQREDAAIDAAELTPNPSARARLASPADQAIRDELHQTLGEGCELGTVNLIVLEVGTPPKGTDGSRVVHATALPSKKCTSALIWVSPKWLAEPVDEPRATSAATPSSTAPPTSGVNPPTTGP